MKERVQVTLETIGISMNYQLRSLIEWAKDLKSFVDLSDNDKVSERNARRTVALSLHSLRLLFSVVIQVKILFSVLLAVH